MKTLVFLIQNFEGGGAERVVLNILNNIDYRLFKIKVLLLENRGVYLEKIKKNKNLEIITFKEKYKYRHLNFFINYIKVLFYLRRSKEKIIFSQMTPGKLLVFFKFMLKNKKLIYRETLIPKGTLNDLNIIVRVIHKLFYKFGIKKHDIIIVQSNDMRDKLLEMDENLKNKMLVINNFVDSEEIENSLEDGIIDEKFDKDKINLISTGRLCRQKGYDLLIKTIGKLNCDNIRLYVLGTGEEERNLKEIVNSLDLSKNVKLLGFKKNPYKYMKCADFFVSSSRVEGFPNAVLEACACGVPIIANNYLGGINEIIVPELNGEIIDITDEKAFKKALNKKYNAKEIKENIRKRFDKKVIIKQYERLFLNGEI